MKFDREVNFILNPNCSRSRGQPNRQGVIPDQLKTGGRPPNFFQKSAKRPCFPLRSTPQCTSNFYTEKSND
jgi:hypothetical protein